MKQPRRENKLGDRLKGGGKTKRTSIGGTTSQAGRGKRRKGKGDEQKEASSNWGGGREGFTKTFDQLKKKEESVRKHPGKLNNRFPGRRHKEGSVGGGEKGDPKKVDPGDLRGEEKNNSFLTD